MVPIQKMVLTMNVPSIEGTISWYETVLGWQGHQDIWDQEGLCLFGSIGTTDDQFTGFNLTRQPQDAGSPPNQCHHCKVWVYVDDVDAVHERVSQNEIAAEPPGDRFWGERTFQIRDLNGFELVFAQTVEDIRLEQVRERHSKLLHDRKGTDPDAD